MHCYRHALHFFGNWVTSSNRYARIWTFQRIFLLFMLSPRSTLAKKSPVIECASALATIERLQVGPWIRRVISEPSFGVPGAAEASEVGVSPRLQRAPGQPRPCANGSDLRTS